jgi:hypothetical protein
MDVNKYAFCITESPKFIFSFGFVFKLDYGNRIWNSKLDTPNNTKDAQM